MTPRETTITVRGDLLTAPWRIRMRDCKEGRIERFKAQALTPANWPTPDGDQEGTWREFLRAAKLQEGNSGHSMEAATACSTRWRGTIDLKGLRKDGFVGAAAVVPAADAAILCGWAEEQADQAGLSTVHHLQGEDGTQQHTACS